MGRGECQNCAMPDQELVRVHRVYVTPESWDSEASAVEVDEIEQWCISCTTQYPHVVLDAPNDSPA
jgi:hypothetical protein